MELEAGVTQKTVELHTDFPLEAVAMKEHNYCLEQGGGGKKKRSDFHFWKDEINTLFSIPLAKYS